MNLQAKLFGYILGDGWITINKECGISGDVESLPNIMKDIDTVYGDGSCRKMRTRQTYSPKYNIKGESSEFSVRKHVTNHMIKLGMPIGKRTEQSYLLPLWIVDGDIDTKISFLSGFYAAEGLIPSLQSNNKTPRPLSFNFYKKEQFKHNAIEISYQFSKIIKDIGLSCSISTANKTTNAPVIVTTITINNSEADFLNALAKLDLTYCMKKERKRQYLYKYFTLKQEERIKIIKIKEKIIKLKQQGFNISTLSEMFNLSKSQISKMLNGRNQCHQVRGFPLFDNDFINKYCLFKTPLNDENLSDIMRQITTCQALNIK